MPAIASKFTNSDYVLIFRAYQDTQDIGDNSSVADWQVEIRKDEGTGFYWFDTRGTKAARFNSLMVVDSGVQALDFRGSTPKTLIIASGRTRIDHDSDGTKSVEMVAAVSGLPIGDARVEGTLTFDRIPRGPRVRYNGSWRNTLAYVRASGVWRIVVPYVRVNGTYRIGGG